MYIKKPDLGTHPTEASLKSQINSEVAGGKDIRCGHIWKRDNEIQGPPKLQLWDSEVRLKDGEKAWIFISKQPWPRCDLDCHPPTFVSMRL